MKVHLRLWIPCKTPGPFESEATDMNTTASSIVTGSLGLAATIGRVLKDLSSFVRDVRDARSDVEGVCGELSSLKITLDLLAEDVEAAPSPVPSVLETHIKNILKNCSAVVNDVQECIHKHQGSRVQKGIKWAAFGKGDMKELRSSLEAHKTTLGLALDMVSVYEHPQANHPFSWLTIYRTTLKEVKKTTEEIRVNTTEIYQDTGDIKQDTARILEAIESLQARLASDDGVRHNMLQRYLDELTTYAGSVIDAAESIKGIDSDNEVPDVDTSHSSPRFSGGWSDDDDLEAETTSATLIAVTSPTSNSGGQEAEPSNEAQSEVSSPEMHSSAPLSGYYSNPVFGTSLDSIPYKAFKRGRITLDLIKNHGTIFDDRIIDIDVPIIIEDSWREIRPMTLARFGKLPFYMFHTPCADGGSIETCKTHRFFNYLLKSWTPKTCDELRQIYGIHGPRKPTPGKERRPLHPAETFIESLTTVMEFLERLPGSLLYWHEMSTLERPKVVLGKLSVSKKPRRHLQTRLNEMNSRKLGTLIFVLQIMEHLRQLGISEDRLVFLFCSRLFGDDDFLHKKTVRCLIQHRSHWTPDVDMDPFKFSPLFQHYSLQRRA